MPIADVVAQPESAPPHWAALRNQDPVENYCGTTDSSLPAWRDGGPRAAGRTGPKITLRGQDRPHSLSSSPHAVCPWGPAVGHPRSVTVYVRKQRRELSRQPADKILSAARERVSSPGVLSHGDRFTPKTADTSAKERQSELVSFFFWVSGLPAERAGGGRATPLDLHVF